MSKMKANQLDRRGPASSTNYSWPVQLHKFLVLDLALQFNGQVNPIPSATYRPLVNAPWINMNRHRRWIAAEERREMLKKDS